MNKFALSEKLLAVLLVAVCAVGALLAPLSAEGIASQKESYARQTFSSSVSFQSLINESAVTMIRTLSNEVNRSDFDYLDLASDPSSFNELLNEGWTQSEINEIRDELQTELEQQFQEAAQLSNLHVIALDQSSGTRVQRPQQSSLQTSWQDSASDYQFWLKAEYDSEGVLSLQSNVSFSAENFAPMELLVDQLGSFWSLPVEIRQPQLKNITLIFGVPQELQGEDAISRLLQQDELNAAYDQMNSLNLILYAVLIAGCFALSGKGMRKTRLGSLLDRVPLEVQVLIALIVLSMTSEMTYNLAALMQQGLSQQRSDADVLIGMIGYQLTFLLEGFGLFCTVYWIRSAFVCGWQATSAKLISIDLWKKGWRQIRRALQTVKQWMKECFTVDFSEKAHSRLIRLMLVNVVLLGALCLFLNDVLAVILYTVFLYLIIMRSLRRLKSDYETLLRCTRRMAEGDLQTPVREELGIFEPLAPELDALRHGFQTAIEEETKSQKMKTELLSNVSHDLKTPLTSLISYIDLMKQEPDEAVRKEYLEVLERNSLRLKHLVEDLFEASKASSGDVKLEIVDVDLVALISQTLFELAPQIEKAGLTMKTSFGREHMIVPLDSQKTYRIVENLISNAAKYSLPGSRVYLTLVEREDEVILSVRNISKTEIDFDPNDIVERFVRGDKSRNTEGSGLGLAIAKGFAEIQKAQFSIETDGDFFKVIVIFSKTAMRPAVQRTPKPDSE